MKKIVFLLHLFFYFSQNLSAGSTESPHAFSTGDYLLLQGKFIPWFAANLISQLSSNDRKLKIAVMLASSIMVPLSEQMNLQNLQFIWDMAFKGFRHNREFWEQVKEIKASEVASYQDFIFNPTTQKELDAIIYRALEHARNHRKQSTILLYGEPGTGKTGVAESLSHWPEFQVYRIPSQILTKASNFRTAAQLCEPDASGKVKVILVDDAEFFLRALTPGSSNYHMPAQEELESEFRTQLGGDSTHCLWFFTSNKIADLEGDMQGALKRRFKNQIWIRRPDKETFLIMLKKFTEQAIHLKKLQIEQFAFNKLSSEALDEYIENISPDALRQIAENSVQLAINEQSSYITAEHFQFFLNAKSQSEEWILRQAEKEFQEKKRKLERMVTIKALERQLESSPSEEKKEK